MSVTYHCLTSPSKQYSNTSSSSIGISEFINPMSNKVIPKLNIVNDCSAINQKTMMARNKKIINQGNEIMNLKKQIDVLINENKTLRTQNIRHEKELSQIDGQCSNVACMMENHDAEVRVMRDQLRKTKAALVQEQQCRKDADSEALKLRAEVYKSRDLIAEKGLQERHELQQQMESAEQQCVNKDILLQETKSNFDHLEKNYRVEFANMKKQTKLYLEKYEELELKYNHIKFSLREKEKLLEIQNIYTNRISTAKINKRNEDRIICQACQFRKAQGDMKARDMYKATVDKMNLETTEKNLIKKGIIQKDKHKSEILEEIREILIEEIKLGKFTIHYNPNYSDQQPDGVRVSSPLQTEDIQINSPFINLDVTEDQINGPDHHRHKKLLYSRNLAKENTCNSSSMISIQKPILQTYSVKQNCLLKDKSFPETSDTNVNSKTIVVADKFLCPDNGAIIISDDWWKDIETISLLDKICTSNSIQTSPLTNHKVEACKLTVVNNADSLFCPIQKLYRLPQIIQQDLLDHNLNCRNKYLSIPKSEISIRNINIQEFGTANNNERQETEKKL